MGRLRAIGALAGAVLALPGCLFFDFGHSPDHADGQRELAIAVGAEVDVQLSQSCYEPLSACSQGMVSRVLEATIADDDGEIELLDFGAADGIGRFRVRAVQAGTARLVVRYRDSYSGVDTTVAISIRAADIVRSVIDVQCDDSFERGGELPISAGSQFGYSTIAYDDGDIELATGNLQLFDPGPFEISSMNGSFGVAIAPDRAGRTTWTAIGGGSVVFDVYDPGDLELAFDLDDTSFAPETTVVLRRLVDGAPACVHGQDARAVIDVAAGDCRPVVADVEFVGGLPVNMRHGGVWFAVGGSGTCSLVATLDGGGSTTTDVEVVTVERGVTSSVGLALSPTERLVGGTVGPGGSCAEAFSDGDCDPGSIDDIDLDGDCFVDSDWVVARANGSSSDTPVGVGLTVALHLQVEAFILSGPPVNLRIDHSSSLAVQNLGCTESTLSQIVAITPESDGSYDLDIEADNIDDTGDYDLVAHDVDLALYGITDVASGASRAEGPLEIFVRSEADVAVSYARDNGDELEGIAPLVVTAGDAAAGATITSDARIHTGTLPNTITLASGVAPTRRTIQIIDESGITGARLLSGPDDGFIPLGDVLCSELVPIGASGGQVFGTSPTRAQISFDAPAVVINTEQSQSGDWLCVEGFAPGVSTMQMSWGGSTSYQGWAVVE